MIRYVILILCLFIFSMCGKEYLDNSAYDERYGEEDQDLLYTFSYRKNLNILKAIKNVPGLGNKEWIASGIALNQSVSSYPPGKQQNELFIQFKTYSNIDTLIPREILTFQYIPKREGTYLFDDPYFYSREDNGKRIPRAGYLRMLYGDVLKRGYRLSENNIGSLTINKVDSINRKIYISFDLYFDSYDKDYSPPKPPHTWSKSINFFSGSGIIDFPK
jgi:hypothetical protein